MKYAVILHFDKKTEKRFTAMIKKMIAGGVNSFMEDNDMPPHITLAAFEKDNREGIVEAFLTMAKKLTPFDIHFAALGVFNPRVLFVSPVMSEPLMESARGANEAYSSLGIETDTRYAPGAWVPHVTLALNLENEELLSAFTLAQKLFKPFSGKSASITLIECCPFKKIISIRL